MDLETGSQRAKKAAKREFERRYEHVFRRRLEEYGVDVDAKPRLYRGYLKLIVKDCEAEARPPFYAADRALQFLLDRGFVGA